MSKKAKLVVLERHHVIHNRENNLYKTSWFHPVVNVVSILIFALLMSGCGDITSTEQITEPAGSQAFGLLRPRIIVSPRIMPEQYALNLRVNGLPVGMLRDGEQWRGTANVPANQEMTVDITWSYIQDGGGLLELITLEQEFGLIQSSGEFGIDASLYNFSNTDGDASTNIEEINNQTDPVEFDVPFLGNITGVYYADRTYDDGRVDQLTVEIYSDESYRLYDYFGDSYDNLDACYQESRVYRMQSLGQGRFSFEGSYVMPEGERTITISENGLVFTPALPSDGFISSWNRVGDIGFESYTLCN